MPNARISMLAIILIALTLRQSPAQGQDTIRMQYCPYVTFIHVFPNATLEFTFGEYRLRFKADSTAFYYADIFEKPDYDTVGGQIMNPAREIDCGGVERISGITLNHWWGSEIFLEEGDTLQYFRMKFTAPRPGSVYQGFDVADTIIYIFEAVNAATGRAVAIDTFGTAPYYADEWRTYADIPDLRFRREILPNDTAMIKTHVFTAEEFAQRTPVRLRWRLLCPPKPIYSLYRRLTEGGMLLSAQEIEHRAFTIDAFRLRIEEIKKANAKQKKL